jgi:hypothetical protein
MHTIDVMHQEHNVGESILSTCMSFADKTKDNLNARRDLAQICNWPTQAMQAILFETNKEERSNELVARFDIPRWLRCGP